MRREGYWVIRTWEAGSVGEKTKFWVPGKRPDKKLTRKQRDIIKKQAQNEYSSVKRLARILHKYFSGGDYTFGLDYSEAGSGSWRNGQKARASSWTPSVKKSEEVFCGLLRIMRSPIFCAEFGIEPRRPVLR